MNYIEKNEKPESTFDKLSQGAIFQIKGRFEVYMKTSSFKVPTGRTINSINLADGNCVCVGNGEIVECIPKITITCK